jgi:hypothetical protein
MCYEKTREIDKAIEQWRRSTRKTELPGRFGKIEPVPGSGTDDGCRTTSRTMDEFYEICKSATESMSLSIRTFPTFYGCQIVAEETESSKCATRARCRNAPVPPGSRTDFESTVAPFTKRCGTSLARGIISPLYFRGKRGIRGNPPSIREQSPLRNSSRNQLPKAKTRT